MAGYFVMPGTVSIQFINRKTPNNIFGGRYKQEGDSGNELCGAKWSNESHIDVVNIGHALVIDMSF